MRSTDSAPAANGGDQHTEGLVAEAGVDSGGAWAGVRLGLFVTLAWLLFGLQARAQDGDYAVRAVEAHPQSLALHSVVAATRSSEELAMSDSDRARLTPRLQWYGWPIAATDGAGVVLTLVWLSDPDDLWPVALTAGTLFTLGAPIVHWAHGFTGRGFLSLGVRAAAMVAFTAGIASLIVAEDDRATETRGHVLVGASIVGLAAMSIVDMAELAFEPAPQRSVLEEEVVLTPWVEPHARTYGFHASLRW